MYVFVCVLVWALFIAQNKVFIHNNAINIASDGIKAFAHANIFLMDMDQRFNTQPNA